MKVYSPTGVVYEGHPIDCRELKAAGGYKDHPPAEKAEAKKIGVKPTRRKKVVKRG